ncbi:CsgG/HfaB family protein [Lentisphaera profundi]|uniref:CsgG/HfaB family protein n=1 Tax=Lentisphaera profundi TaxID=1658616 RepID=A0ABY7VUP4_9BACT|nr:CsgG/HfaB family protein [Lentisphaera profundi]WDE97621.1 CsgG/HfaB family protein [Lentisphaera profundi]
MKHLLILMALLPSLIFAYAEKTVVSIINVEVSKKISSSAGAEIEELLNAFLSVNDELLVVERKKLEDLLKEQASSEAGFMDEESRVKVQKLYGVKYFISAKLFSVGSKMYLTTNVIDVETSEKKTFMVKTSARGDYSDLAEQSGEKLLLAIDDLSSKQKVVKLEDPRDILKAKFKGQELPTVAIFIEEQHVAQAVIDPAAQTELMDIMKQAGFVVKEYKSSIKSDLFEDGIKEIKADLKDVDIIILGEGISQFALRRGELISCKARLEIKALQKNNEKVLAIKSLTSSGVDVSEAIAGKEALQNCANNLAVKFISEMMETWKEK